MKPIAKERFEALIAHTRQPPAAGVCSKELEWYASDDEILLATIIIDLDNEFSTTILGRDADSKYRCINFPMIFEDIEESRKYMFTETKKILAEGESVFSQGDESNKKQDLFHIICAKEKINPHFEVVRSLKEYSSAREIIAEIMPHFKDVDGNFIKDFQSTGFDSRIWELYLFTYLTEERLFINREYEAPDFLVSDGRQKVAIEAVTVNASQENEDIENLTPEKIVELLKNDIPLKFGSALFSRMNRKNKKYWELEHVKDYPLIFAIADFSSQGSMRWSSTALSKYLYGMQHDWHISDDGQLIINPTEIEFTKANGKPPIPGFFFSKDAEYISAVLFSATGTISKFIRMGKMAGFGDSSIAVKYSGLRYDHSHSLYPNKFFFEVDSNYKESWGSGISIFHNPNALYPLSREDFPSVAHYFMEKDGQIASYLPTFYPFNGTTLMHSNTDIVTKEDFDSLHSYFSTVTGKAIDW